VLKQDLTGRKFGYLTVIKLNVVNHRGMTWFCQCECGNTVILATYQLVGSKTRRPEKSCGCKQYAHNKIANQHPRIYSIWRQMINRCYRVESENYDRYGAKGIKVCEEWLNSFDTFLEWALESGYKEELNINRIDPKKDYEPSNCRWANIFVQMQNRGMMKTNTSGYTGVSQLKDGSYKAYIQRNNVKKDLGTFSELMSAVEARKKAEELFKETGHL
jgi:hypothetical protein